MSTSKSFVAVCVAIFAVSMLSACGGGQDDAQDPGEVASAPAGNSGLIPIQTGFAEMDLARAQAVKSFGRCAVDAINGHSGKAAARTIGLNSTDRVKVSGWAVTPDKRSPSSVAVVLLGNENAYALRADGGRVRADVARAMKSAEARRAGYTAESDLQGVLPGEYAVSVLQDTGGVSTICASRFRIALSGK